RGWMAKRDRRITGVGGGASVPPSRPQSGHGRERKTSAGNTATSRIIVRDHNGSPTKEHGMSATPAATATHTSDDARDLATTIANYPPHEAVSALAGEEDATIAQMLERMNPGTAIAILWEFPEARRAAIVAQAGPECAHQWSVNYAFPEDTIGRLMAPVYAEFPPNMTVAEAIRRLRSIVQKALVSYAFVVDAEKKLVGVLVFRDM